MAGVDSRGAGVSATAPKEEENGSEDAGPCAQIGSQEADREEIDSLPCPAGSHKEIRETRGSAAIPQACDGPTSSAKRPEIPPKHAPSRGCALERSAAAQARERSAASSERSEIEKERLGEPSASKHFKVTTNDHAIAACAEFRSHDTWRNRFRSQWSTRTEEPPVTVHASRAQVLKTARENIDDVPVTHHVVLAEVVVMLSLSET